jgi:hypothetical protein
VKQAMDEPFEMLTNVGETDIIGRLLRNRRNNMNYAVQKTSAVMTVDLTSTDIGSRSRPGKKICNMQPYEGKNGVSLICFSRSCMTLL